MQSPWSVEIARALAFALAAAIGGWLTGLFGLCFVAAGIAFCGWHIYNLHRLNRWLSKSRSAYPPELGGIWGEVFHQLYRQRMRDRKRKKRLKSVIREFRESTAALPDGVVVLNPGWEILWFNDAAESLLGLQRPRDAGRNIANFLRLPMFVNYMNGGDFAEPLEADSPYYSSTRLSLQIVPYGAGQYMLLVRDITRVALLERMRQDFVANVSHELRSPLTVLGGYLETMLDSPEGKDLWQRPLREMQRESARMVSIVSDLLALSRLEAADEQAAYEAINIEAMLAAIHKECMAFPDREAEITLKLESATDLQGVESELYSAFSNLVMNAVRYTGKGGEISMHWFADDDGGSFSVSDTGVGIDPGHIPRLTERFYRVDKARERATGGTGLGLAIVKHVLQRHDGELLIESTPGEGSVFTCHFPSSRLLAPVRYQQM